MEIIVVLIGKVGMNSPKRNVKVSTVIRARSKLIKVWNGKQGEIGVGTMRYEREPLIFSTHQYALISTHVLYPTWIRETAVSSRYMSTDARPQPMT